MWGGSSLQRSTFSSYCIPVPRLRCMPVPGQTLLSRLCCSEPQTHTHHNVRSPEFFGVRLPSCQPVRGLPAPRFHLVRLPDPA